MIRCVFTKEGHSYKMSRLEPLVKDAGSWAGGVAVDPGRDDGSSY